MAKTKITVAEAAKIMGIAPMCLRIALRQGKFTSFAQAWQNNDRWTYYINKERFEQYLKAKNINDELFV